MLARRISVLLMLAVSATASSIDSRKALEGFDQDVERARQVFQSPGIAVGVIRDGKVVLAKGYGVREVGKEAPVTANTIFAVGSMTKSFTALTVALMVDDGKLEWDRPVRDFLPWFTMFDPVATALITPRDLLTPRSGLPGHNFIRFSTPLSREELVRRIRYLEPSRTFRDVYQYNNLMYTTAGYLAGYVAGTTWEELVKQHIFAPLGMTNSTVSVMDTQTRKDYAHPHLLKDGHPVAVEFYDYQRFGVGPNGAVNSCINDLLKYLQCHLDKARQLVSPEQSRQLYKPVSVDGTAGYAPGWRIEYHRGAPVVDHGGAITGFTSMMLMLPEEKIGIVVFNNIGSAAPQALAWDLADRMLGLEPQHYVDEAKQKNDNAAKPKRLPPVAGTKPTLELAAYTGEYFHPAYGVVNVERDGGVLIVRFGALDVKLNHYNYDTFECESPELSGLAQFRLSTQGKVGELLLPLEPAVKPLVFTRR